MGAIVAEKSCVFLVRCERWQGLSLGLAPDPIHTGRSAIRVWGTTHPLRAFIKRECPVHDEASSRCRAREEQQAECQYDVLGLAGVR